MDLHEKIRNLPTRPGVYLYKNADGEVDVHDGELLRRPGHRLVQRPS